MSARFAIYCAHSKEYSPLANLTVWSNIKQYCNLHGYELICEEFDTWIPSKSPWDRLRSIRQHLPKYEWIWLLGVDCIITNFNKRIEDFIDNDFHFIGGLERVGINADSLFFRNSPEGFKWLEFLLDQEENYSDTIFKEQSAINDWRHIYGWPALIKCVPQKECNSFPEAFPGFPAWERGDWVCHLYGRSLQDRLSQAPKFLDQVDKGPLNDPIGPIGTLGPKNSRPAIAVYSIAKNEVKHVHQWAESAKEADLMIVADTGSTDGTQVALASHGVTVHQISVHPWRFDDARNAILALIPKDIDVCLSLDMDEVLAPGFVDEIRSKWNGCTAGHVNINTGHNWKSKRLHARNGYRWVAPCHEVVECYDGNEKVKDFDIRIDHLQDRSKSRSQYLSMLQMAVKEKPGDARMLCYLCREYYYQSNWPKVIESAEKMLATPGGWPVERAYVCRMAAQSGIDSYTWLHRGTCEASLELEPWFYLAYHHYTKGEWKQCFHCADKVNTLKRPNHYLVEPEVWDWKCFDLLCISAWRLGLKQESMANGLKATKGNPSNPRLAANVKWLEEHA